jgi:hypothetical protein
MTTSYNTNDSNITQDYTNNSENNNSENNNSENNNGQNFKFWPCVLYRLSFILYIAWICMIIIFGTNTKCNNFKNEQTYLIFLNFCMAWIGNILIIYL